MLSETVKSIKEAEEKANETVKKASENAKKLIQEARIQGEALIKETEKHALESEKAEAEKAEKTAQAIFGKEKQRACEMSSVLAALAASRTNKALEAVIGGINAKWQ